MGMGVRQKLINCIAFDCGNSSIRTVLGCYDGEKISLQVVHQAENDTVEVNGLFYWDILHIFNELKNGIKKAYQECGHIDSAGICTWGVDFGLLDASGHLLANPLSYRNMFGEDALSSLSKAEREFMFNQTGIQNDRINSIYQLLGMRKVFGDRMSLVRDVLLIPDLLVNMLTGSMGSERTIASTTQILDVRRGEYSSAVLDMWRLPSSWFKPIREHGSVYGYLRENLAHELKVKPFPFICVASHDTASAVAAVPTEESNPLFISSGTWSLIGVELQAPVISRAAYEAGFTNEAGAFDTITFLKNSAGMYIIQRVKKELANEGKNYSWDEMVAMASGCEEEVPVFDPNDALFFNPESMIQAIRKYFDSVGSNASDIGAIIKSVYRSLARSYEQTLAGVSKVTGIRTPTIHIVGGGSKNQFLNQLTADLTGKTVIAGPVEATSLGNIAVQLKYHRPDLDLKGIRAVIRQSVETKEYTPRVAIEY